jgi:hypothetical protein
VTQNHSPVIDDLNEAADKALDAELREPGMDTVLKPWWLHPAFLSASVPKCGACGATNIPTEAT